MEPLSVGMSDEAATQAQVPALKKNIERWTLLKNDGSRFMNQGIL